MGVKIMDSSVLLLAAIGSIALFLVLSAILLTSSARVSTPGYPLWPPTYFFPDRARKGRLEESSDGPPTGSFRIPTGPTGIAIEGDSTNPTAHRPEDDPTATGAYLIAQPPPARRQPHSNIPATDETNRIRLPDLNTDEWLNAETNKTPSPPRGTTIPPQSEPTQIHRAPIQPPPKAAAQPADPEGDPDDTAKLPRKPVKDPLRDTNPKKPKGFS